MFVNRGSSSPWEFLFFHGIKTSIHINRLSLLMQYCDLKSIRAIDDKKTFKKNIKNNTISKKQNKFIKKSIFS